MSFLPLYLVVENLLVVVVVVVVPGVPLANEKETLDPDGVLVLTKQTNIF